MLYLYKEKYFKSDQYWPSTLLLWCMVLVLILRHVLEKWSCLYHMETFPQFSTAGDGTYVRDACGKGNKQGGENEVDGKIVEGNPW